MQRIKIIHLHTDLKFVVDSARFDGNEFDNTVIIIGDRNEYKGHYKDSALFYKFSLSSIRSIIDICNSADIVVLYDLCSMKAYIANQLPTTVIVIWRFFGMELYSKMPEYVFSKKTLIANVKQNKKGLLLNLKDVLSPIYNILKFRTIFKREFDKAAFKRVDYFHGLSEKEYLFLKEYWPKLPPFLQINYKPYTKISITNNTESNLILVGNNRSAYNNHLDIIDLIQKSNNNNKFKFLMVFNYGQNSPYANAVRTKAAEVKEIEVLDDFLTIEKFNYLQSNTNALVMNGYRQMAMGSIFIALRNNVKIYLNKKNIMLDWLKEEGFKVFTIEDFSLDLERESIQLTENEVLHNQNQMIKFTQKYNKEDFHNSLKKILKK